MKPEQKTTLTIISIITILFVGLGASLEYKEYYNTNKANNNDNVCENNNLERIGQNTCKDAHKTYEYTCTHCENLILNPLAL